MITFHAIAHASRITSSWKPTKYNLHNTTKNGETVRTTIYLTVVSFIS